MQQIARTITLAYNVLPRRHRIIVGVLTFITITVAVWRPAVYHPEQHAGIQDILLDTRQSDLDSDSLLPEASEPIDQISPSDDIPQDELDQKEVRENGLYEYVVSTGDTLSSILTQYGIDISDIALLALHPGLRNLQVGQQISWSLNEDGDLQSLTWEVSRLESRLYERQDNNKFKETKKLQKGEWRNTVFTGRMNGSFVTSAKAAGLKLAEIQAVTKALQWQLDFRKLRHGDKFAVLMSREELDGDGHSRKSQLLGVRMRSGGKDYYAIRAEDGNFYDRQGSGLARGFMRFPTLKQFRISSHFNPRRFHPITGRVAPHRGVDFSMPVGTPILAVGDGEVVVAKYDSAAGYYLTIRHGRQYSTRYMHLKKILVKQGDKVKRGDRIALSGNTGRSTGPHLHYEFWINQQSVNPLKTRLPGSESLNGQTRKDYLELMKQTIPQLQFN